MKNIFLLIFLLIFLYIICNRCIEKFSVGGSDINISENLILSYIDKCDPSECNQMECMKDSCPINMGWQHQLLECYLNCSNKCSDKSVLVPVQPLEYGPCMENTDCLTNKCQDNLCISSIPWPSGYECRDDIECNSGLCVGNRCSELKPWGRRCTENRECVTDNCEGEGKKHEYKVCMSKECKNGKDCPDDTLCWVGYNADHEKEGRCDSSKTCKTLDGDMCPYNLTKCTWDASTGECRNI